MNVSLTDGQTDAEINQGIETLSLESPFMKSLRRCVGIACLGISLIRSGKGIPGASFEVVFGGFLSPLENHNSQNAYLKYSAIFASQAFSLCINRREKDPK